jgi:CheY-like chemotaxis protein
MLGLQTIGELGRVRVAVRVTVLDDDQDVLDLFRELFVDFGYEVETYADALPGIGELIASSPDLIVVDLRMAPEREELTGLQIVHSARSGTELRDVPIIVCSADPEGLAAAWPDLMKRGDIQQLAKPFDLETFERVVQTALGISHGDVDATRQIGNPSATTESDKRDG